MTSIGDLVSDLTAAVPDLRPLIDEHRDVDGELLSHPFMADVTRWLVAHGPSPVVLELLDRHLRDGHEAVQDVIWLSFLENLEQEHTQLRAALGPGLRAGLAELEGWCDEDAI
jgi:hypothetical protein